MIRSKIILGILVTLLVACSEDTKPIKSKTKSIVTAQNEVVTSTVVSVEIEPGQHVWEMDRSASTLMFTGKAYGQEVTGQFTEFDAGIVLNPDAPSEAGMIKAIVAMASFDAGNEDRNSMLPSSNWFSIKAYPVASFESMDIALTGRESNQPLYVANGMLTIKGVAKPAAILFTLDVDGDRAVANGAIEIDRTDFEVGQGAYANPNDISPEISIRMKIVANKTSK